MESHLTVLGGMHKPQKELKFLINEDNKEISTQYLYFDVHFVSFTIHFNFKVLKKLCMLAQGLS